MEIIQGKPKDKKIVIAQEIAFAKALAGNNKTLRDRAVKKLRKWLTVRGNGAWSFTEEEFSRIWTGLFYCMWMSDKFFIQEELAESISNLIHCFKKNSESALLFIKCFHKRILMDWEGLDQYRIDKFNMLVRRFLRQTFVYFKEKNWEETILQKLMGVFYNLVLHRDNSLGFVLHFINIYLEELAKVSKGKLSTSTVLILIEPFVKLLARTKDMRIQKEAEDFFIYLMRQTDTGIEFEEMFNAWREQGFPGDGPHCMKSIDTTHENQENEDKFRNKKDEIELEEEDSDNYDDEDINNQDQPLDPRAGSVHVYLPQIPINVDGFISLFKKHQNSKHSTNKGRRILKSLSEKYGALGRGKFPVRIKKDPILTENLKKKKMSLKNAKKLMEFTQQINQGPIETEEFCEINKELEEQESWNSEDEESVKTDSLNEDVIPKKIKTSKHVVQKINNRAVSKKQKLMKNSCMTDKGKVKKKLKISNELMQEVKENGNQKENGAIQKVKIKKLNSVGKKKKLEGSNVLDTEMMKTKKNHKISGVTNRLLEDKRDLHTITNANKAGRKRKILSNWQVQELDSSSPEYYNINTPKIIKLERKINDNFVSETKTTEKVLEKRKLENEKTSNEAIVPHFWEKAMQKANKKNSSKSNIFLNPFVKLQTESKSPGRRISFALEKNMSQENEQYLEEVKNSPKVPFDGSKKPVQSALKSGLAPSPVNPFYRFKKIKF